MTGSATNVVTQSEVGLRVSLVTGGAGPAIGQGISTALANAGHQVVIGDIDLDAAKEAARRLSEEGLLADAVRLDISDPSSVDTAVAWVAERYGRLDHLACSAGVGLEQLAAEAHEAEVARLMSINLIGPWRCIRAAVPIMRAGGGGSIVTIGSVHRHGAEELYAFYSASKAALAALSRGVARDHGADGIRCNTVHPGAVQGPIKGTTPSYLRFVRTRQMLPVELDGADVGNAVAFLLSDRARGITGTELYVDAGTSAMLFDKAE